MGDKEAVAPPRTKVLLVYVGDWAGDKTARVGGYLRVTRAEFDAGTLPDGVNVDTLDRGAGLRFYGARSKVMRSMRGSPGMAYELDTDDPDGSTVYGGGSYAGQWPDEDDRARWATAHRSRVRVLDLESRRKADAKHDDMLSCLEPIRAAYHSAVGPQRAHILALAVERITRRPRR